ncbi:MAG: hypothetical protein KDC79_05510 [Cyclobacteriaceae bacterium]|nr:hypothetical protein [Cyclobacteriaceae bacterium]
MKKLLVLILSVLCVNASVAGGGWPQPKGKGYFKLSQMWIISNQHFTDVGEIDPNATRASYFTNIYGEYGITDRFTGIVYWPFFVRSVAYEQVSGTTGNVIVPGDAINGIGDMDLTIKYGLTPGKRIATSASLLLGLPLGQSTGGYDGTLQTGDGEFNQMIQLDAGTSFKVGNLYPYANVLVAFNNRTGGFSDELRYGIEAGLEYKRFFGVIRLYGIHSFKNGEPNFNTVGTSLFANNVEYLGITPELSYRFSEKWGLTGNVGMAAWGKLILASPTFSVGVYFKP